MFLIILKIAVVHSALLIDKPSPADAFIVKPGALENGLVAFELDTLPVSLFLQVNIALILGTILFDCLDCDVLCDYKLRIRHKRIK
jgi:hypothetical protein